MNYMIQELIYHFMLDFQRRELSEYFPNQKLRHDELWKLSSGK